MSYASSTVPKKHWNPKYRKAFEKRTKMMKYARSKRKYTSQSDLLIDWERMGKLQEEKGKQLLIRILYLFGSILLFSLSIYFIGMQNGVFTSSPCKAKLYYRLHGTVNVEQDLNNMGFLKNGYLAWSQEDYSTAIFWFEQVADSIGDRYRKEFALMGLYEDVCKKEQGDCEKYEQYETILRQKYRKWYPDYADDQILRNANSYNYKMFKYFRYDVPKSWILGFSQS